ncbi:MAG TPA: hypothetical protein PLX23_03685, partial [Candidatus Hydrogenedens sp.]|nr:hypothetical protein [Candidatus Hydrogenedens sp.]
AIENAAKQGAFIQWNHPDFNTATRNNFEFQKKLLDKGYLHGVEVSNGSDWYPYVIDWGLENNLTLMGNSDLHGLIVGEFNIEKFQRPMTLVFAKEQSIQGVREALDNKRTVVWIADMVGGREEWLSQLFLSCVKFDKIKIVNSEKKEGKLEIQNVSNIPWYLKCRGPVLSGSQRLEPRSSTIMKAKGDGPTNITVTNAWVRTGVNLQIEINLQ